MFRILKLLSISLFLALLNGCISKSKIDQIIIADISDSDRGFIAKEISILASLNPRVMAVDVRFVGEKSAMEDSLLEVALQNVPDLVMITKIDDYLNGENNKYSALVGSLPRFLTNATEGYSNVVLENDRFHSLKKFSISENVNGKLIYHFAVQTALQYDSTTARKFIDCHKGLIDVEYYGNIESYRLLSTEDILGGRIKEEDVKDKIVMVGSLSPFDNDKFVTSLNENDSGVPDMFGVVYLANIVNQIISFNGCQ